VESRSRAVPLLDILTVFLHHNIVCSIFKMAGETVAQEERSVQLREELKLWEKNFSADNAGQKPSREHIKANADIGWCVPSHKCSWELTSHAAAKYKEYNKLREIMSGKFAPPNTSKTNKKRKSGGGVPLTPSKRQKSADETPRRRKDSKSEQELVPGEEPSPVAKRTMMGPTPQRDGMFMGIFDDIPTGTAVTPSKDRSILGSIHVNIVRTPSRADRLLVDDALVEERARPSRTPTSSSKRNLFAQFVTPGRKQPREEGTPSSSRKLLFTPSFLRRDNLPLDTVQEEQRSPEVRRPWRPRNFMRTLSGMIQDRRKEEDERVDEEWEAMLEMEDETAPSKASGVPKIVLEDNQRPVVLDAEGFVPSEGEETEVEEIPQLDRNGQPRKPYKKKGLKRQTRRVISKPTPPCHIQTLCS
jgi:hypothetical protein